MITKICVASLARDDAVYEELVYYRRSIEQTGCRVGCDTPYTALRIINSYPRILHFLLTKKMSITVQLE